MTILQEVLLILALLGVVGIWKAVAALSRIEQRLFNMDRS